MFIIQVKIMRTEEQIEEEIKSIKINQEQLKKQNRNEEADYWNDIIYYLKWVIK